MAKILLADDDTMLRKLVAVHLNASGHVTVEAANGQEALSHMSGSGADLIILDYMMPQGDGPSVLRAIRAMAKYAQVPIIMLTARSGGEDKVHAFEAGADDYVVKPFHVGELNSRVARLLRAG